MAFFENINLNSLSPVEQDIYRFIINNITKIPYMRVREIADSVHVSPTSVFRFIQKIGYRSFPEFRVSVEMKLKNSDQKVNTELLSIKNHIDSLKIGSYHPDIDYQIEKLAKKIKNSAVILFMGMGASGAIAQYAARKIASLGYFSLYIDELTYPIKSFLKKDRENLLIFLSVSGETKELIEVVSGVEKRKSTQLYCITQNRRSSLSQMCDYSIEYDVKEERREVFFDLTSQLPVIAILEALIAYFK